MSERRRRSGTSEPSNLFSSPPTSDRRRGKHLEEDEDVRGERGDKRSWTRQMHAESEREKERIAAEMGGKLLDVIETELPSAGEEEEERFSGWRRRRRRGTMFAI